MRLVVTLSSLLCLALATEVCSAAPEVSDSNAVRWDPAWTKMRPVEYGLTVGFGLSSGAIMLFVDPPNHGPWGGVLYDDAVRSALRAETRSGRDTARTIGDFGYRSMLFFPFLDAGITAGLVHQNSEVTWQMLAIDGEAMGLAGLLGIASEHFIGRARPSQAECKKDPHYEALCNGRDEFGAFFSGHTAIAAAGAGLTCAHHLNMPLYGNRIADIGACVATSGLAVMTGVARVMNDRHWATDVTTGLIVGAASGLGVPLLFHYRKHSTETVASAPSSFRIGFAPALAPGNYGAQFSGVF